ncbi:hypothetical protein B296_00034574 [Ensete ventricosum]|uniref:Uncharacterized protein n=1 Tax=Ensete ventricosum TaxID=4639 RepID=A0A426Y5V0_ENSVE|nr:hypothetical protein B296_00034574 [Ensete ventricosum]
MSTWEDIRMELGERTLLSSLFLRSSYLRSIKRSPSQKKQAESYQNLRGRVHVTDAYVRLYGVPSLLCVIIVAVALDAEALLGKVGQFE